MDETLRIYEALRRRKYAQMERYENAASGQRYHLNKMDLFMFADWSGMAHAARLSYLYSELASEAFLRQIDTNHELSGYQVEPPKKRPQNFTAVESAISI